MHKIKIIRAPTKERLLKLVKNLFHPNSEIKTMSYSGVNEPRMTIEFK